MKSHRLLCLVLLLLGGVMTTVEALRGEKRHHRGLKKDKDGDENDEDSQEDPPPADETWTYEGTFTTNNNGDTTDEENNGDTTENNDPPRDESTPTDNGENGDNPPPPDKGVSDPEQVAQFCRDSVATNSYKTTNTYVTTTYQFMVNDPESSSTNYGMAFTDAMTKHLERQYLEPLCDDNKNDLKRLAFQGAARGVRGLDYRVLNRRRLNEVLMEGTNIVYFDDMYMDQVDADTEAKIIRDVEDAFKDAELIDFLPDGTVTDSATVSATQVTATAQTPLDVSGATEAEAQSNNSSFGETDSGMKPVGKAFLSLCIIGLVAGLLFVGYKKFYAGKPVRHIDLVDSSNYEEDVPDFVKEIRVSETIETTSTFNEKISTFGTELILENLQEAPRYTPNTLPNVDEVPPKENDASFSISDVHIVMDDTTAASSVCPKANRHYAVPDTVAL